MRDDMIMPHRDLMLSMRPAPPRFTRVRNGWRVENLPWFSKQREVYLPLNFKRFRIPEKKLTPWSQLGVLWVDRCTAPVFYNIKAFMDRWSTTEIVNSFYYRNVQEAIDAMAGNQILFVQPGTYDENLDIGQSGLTVCGHYRNTIIDGGITGPAFDIRDADDVTIAFLEARTTPGGGAAVETIATIDSSRSKIMNVFVNGSDTVGILPGYGAGADHEILNCYIYDTDGDGIYVLDPGTKVRGCTIHDAGIHGITVNEVDCIIQNNIIRITGNDGIWLVVNCEDSIVTDNRITGWTNEPIDNDGVNNDVSHNKTV